MRLHIGIIVNPLARRTGAPDLPQRLEACCKSAAEPVEATLFVTRAEAELPAALFELRRRGAEVLAVCGGDGTLMATASAAIAAYGAALPPFLLLPGGTMNTIARNLGLGSGLRQSSGPAAVLSRLLAALTAAGEKGIAGVPRFAKEVMRVVTADERPLKDGKPAQQSGVSRTRYGCIFGAAMGARYLAEYSRRPNLSWAAWLGLRTIFSSLIPGGGPFARWLFERTAASLYIDGERAEETAFRLLLCATVPDVGLGMRVPWRAGCVRGRFHLIASSLPITANALQIGRMQRGQPLLGQPHLDRLVQDAKVRFETPQPLTLDGELFAASAVELSIGPAIEFLLPP